MSHPVELVPGKLHMLGDAEAIDDRVSWLPGDVPGYQPLNCYLVRTENVNLIIDTGVAKHRDAIVDQLRALADPQLPFEVFLTRAESDAIGNLLTISSEFDLAAVHTGGVLNPFDAFEAAGASEESSVPIRRIEANQKVELAPGVALYILQPLLRVLATYWAYEESTKTLFSSDAFGYVTIPDAGARPVQDAADSELTVDEVARRMLTKYAYLGGAVGLSSIQDDLRRIFQEHDIQVIAPAHGSAIVGPESVQQQYDLVQGVLTTLDGR